MAAADIGIRDLLASLGLEGESAALGRAALEAAALTNPRKQRISADKAPAAREAIDAALARLCRRCSADAAGESRPVVVVPARSCSRCGGSANVRALDDLVSAAERAGVRRLVLVGGSPDLRREFGAIADRLEVRLVDGTERRTKEEAKRDLAWADVIVVGGSSELGHKVSVLYTRDPLARGKVIVSARRGVEAVAGEVVLHLSLRGGAPRRR